MAEKKEYVKYKELDNFGYILLNINGEQIREHRYVMEKYLGRKLTSEECVHHIDLNKTNNNIDNLFLFQNDTFHQLYHAYIKKNFYISPYAFLKKYSEVINNIYSYEYLFDNYVNKKQSASHIAKNIDKEFGLSISRVSIINRLKQLNIYSLRQATVNQFD